MRADGAAVRLAGDLPLPPLPTCRNVQLYLVQFPAMKNLQGVWLFLRLEGEADLRDLSEDDVRPRDEDLDDDDFLDDTEDDDLDRPLSFPLSLNFPKVFFLPNFDGPPRLGVGFLLPPLGLESPLDGFRLAPSVAGAAGPCILLRLSSTFASSCLRSMYVFAALNRKAYDLSLVPTSAR